MTNLEQALINSGQAVNEKDANDIVRQMVIRTKDFEEPFDILDEFFPEFDLERSWVDDILNWIAYNPNRANQPPITPTPSPLAPEKAQTMMVKIKALLDKAASSDSQEEKDAFMMKAQELIQKHSLSAEKIMAVKGTNRITDEDIIEERISYEEEWDRLLMKAIAEGNMCDTIFNSSAKQIYVIGKESNASSVVMLIDFYRKAILNLAVESAKGKSRVSKILAKKKGEVPSRDLARIEHQEQLDIKDYLFGAVDGLKNALYAKEVLFYSESFVGETGLMVTGREVSIRNKDRIKEYIAMKYPNLGHFRSGAGGNSDSRSYQRGQADGGGLGAGQRRLH